MHKQKFQLFDFLHVTWEDVWGQSDWFTDKGLKERVDAYRALSVDIGWLAYQDKERIVLAASQSMDDDDRTWSNISVIPKSLIRKIRKIKI